MEFNITKITVGPFDENTWLVSDPAAEAGVVIDPGDEPERIAALIDDQGIAPAAILNTHGHLDHIGGVKTLQERYDIPFYLHGRDAFLLNQSPEHAELFGVPMHGIPEMTHDFAGMDRVEIAGLSFRIIPTPGHTPGGVSLLIGSHLFAGDTLFAGSVGRTDLPGGDYETLLSSIREQLLPLDDEITVHPGHGPDTTIGKERQSNPFVKG